MKRGQVTIFIIISLIVVSAIALVLYYKGALKKSEVEEVTSKGIIVPPQIQPFADFIQSCAEEVSSNSIRMVSYQGGFFNPQNAEFIGDSPIAYWYYSGNDTSPTIETIQTEIEQAITTYMPECIAEYEDPELVVNTVQPTANVQITNEKIIIKTFYPAELTYKEENFKISNEPFEVEIKSDLKAVYQASQSLLKKQAENPFYLPSSFIADLGYETVYLPLNSVTGLYLLEGEKNSLMFTLKFEEYEEPVGTEEAIEESEQPPEEFEEPENGTLEE